MRISDWSSDVCSSDLGLVFLDLPIGEGNPVRRLERIAECMNQLKNSRQAVVVYGLLAALGMAPPQLQALALELFSRKASAVATNVPGRSEEHTSELQSLMRISYAVFCLKKKKKTQAIHKQDNKTKRHH